MIYTIAILYLTIAILLYCFQGSLIFPGSHLQGTQQTQVIPGKGERLVHLTTPSGPLVALYSPAESTASENLPDAADHPTVIYFYGNGESISVSLAESQAFRRIGFNVLIPDYPGYGMSGGKPSGSGIYAAADACYEYLTTSQHVAPQRIAVVGRSLGGAAAIYLAAKHPLGALITLSAFRTLAEIAGNTVHHLFPTGFLVLHRLDNIGRMPQVHCPTLIIHGTDDELVPFDSAAALAHATSAPVTVYPVGSATHNDIYDVGGQSLVNTMEQFLARAMQKPRQE